MFYPGMRSPGIYLARLASVSNSGTPTDLVAVAGGLAFLHALSETTTSLLVVDVDADTLVHWTLVRALILDAQSMSDFMTLLARRVPTGSLAAGSVVFGPPADVARRLSAILSRRERSAYDKTYGSLTVDAAGVGVGHGATTVHFVGGDLTPLTFNWQFGTGNLADEARFQMLRSCLQRIPTQVRQVPFQQLHYDTDFPATPGRTRVCLASNCESPIFTREDVIFLRVLKTARSPVRYVSWQRDAVVADGRVSSAAVHPAEVVVTPAQTVLWSDSSDRVPVPAGPFLRTIASLRELQRQPEYARAMLLVPGRSPAEVRACLAAVAPSFKAVVWIPTGDCPTTLDWSLPNYDARLSAVSGDHTRGTQPAWVFALAGAV